MFVIFEGGMPLIGLGVGTALARGIGHLAGAAVIVIGIWMLLAGDNDEDEKARRITTSRGPALIALGINISLDELAVGFSIGLARLQVAVVIVAIALQAFIAAQLGLALGAGIGELRRNRAEQVAGAVLILLGASSSANTSSADGHTAASKSGNRNVSRARWAAKVARRVPSDAVAGRSTTRLERRAELKGCSC